MNKSKNLARQAMIAAVYTVISLAFAPFAYGAIQVRFSEALTLLPIFTPDAIVGVTIGCFITNMIGSSPIDMVFGTLATFISAVMTYKLRNVMTKGLPIAAAIPPILVNAVVVGFEITFFFSDIHTLPILLLNMLTVGLGQVVSCLFIGIIMVKFISSSDKLRELISK
ncbi:MAG: QueT transporter family protein [Oscillospiraceae bacterium]